MVFKKDKIDEYLNTRSNLDHGELFCYLVWFYTGLVKHFIESVWHVNIIINSATIIAFEIL